MSEPILAASGPKLTRVWAFELNPEDDGAPTYLAQATANRFYWTVKPELAMLFCRRSDAVSILSLLDYHVRGELVVTPLMLDISKDLV